jgi:benzodiazapine receptor
MVELCGGLMTDLSPWYDALKKPSWEPPSWLFAPAWTLIFALAAIAGALAWRDSADRASRRRILALFAINALLNVLWSALFFQFERPDWALVEVVFLWLSVAALAAGLTPISGTAGWLLTPYLVWVAFAGTLNLTIVRLNTF